MIHKKFFNCNKIFGYILITSNLFLGISCNKKETIITQTEYNSKIKNVASTQGACNCQSNPCKFYDILFFCPCAKKILNNQNSRNFIVNWNTNCCGGGMSVSYGKVCYTGDKNELYVQLSNIPGCLYDCFGDVYCFRATIIKCTQHSFYIGWNDSVNSMELTNDDIYMNLKCNINGVYYECKGDVQWQ